MGCHDPTLLYHGAAVPAERRAYPRFQVALSGVCSVAGGDDEACIILDLSLSGAKVVHAGAATVGADVSLLLPNLGLLVGRVARVTDDGFGVEFTSGFSQRRRVQDYLVFILRLRDDPAIDGRAFERIVPMRRVVEVRCADARTHMARIRDVSRSGIALTTTVAMTIGEEIMVGATAAHVVRVFDGGATARFRTPLPPAFDATVTL